MPAGGAGGGHRPGGPAGRLRGRGPQRTHLNLAGRVREFAARRGCRAHGARGGRDAGGTAADREREAGPQRACRTPTTRPARPGGHRPPAREGDRLRRVRAGCSALPQVGAEDSFFELGGNSLLAVDAGRAAARARACRCRADPVRDRRLRPGWPRRQNPTRSRCLTVRIPAGATEITPDMLPLAELTAEQISLAIGSVPAGRPTSPTSTRWHRCRRASSSTTC